MVPFLELYGAKTGNALRVAIALEEAQLTYSVRRLDLAAGDQRAPEHLALDPRGRIPVLVSRSADPADEQVLTQSNAIALWIDAQAPGRVLPSGGRSRTVAIERWLFFVTDVIGPNRAGFVLRRAGLAVDAAAHHDREAIAALADAERFLAEGPFMAGHDFSLADIAGFTIASVYRAGLDWAPLPNLRRWYEDVGARASVRRGMAAFDPPGQA